MTNIEETGQFASSPPDPPDVPTYRAISPLAVVACVLAALSPLALAHPVLWIVPAAAVVLATWALRLISRHADRLVGRRAALAGLAIALFFGAWAPTRLALQRVVLPRQARHFAQYWFDLVRNGRVYEAHQWTRPPGFRLPSDVDLRQAYESDADAKEDLRKFLRSEPIDPLVRFGTAAEVRFVKTLDLEGNSRKSLSVLRFEIVTPRQDRPPQPVRLAVERTRVAGTGTPQWRVYSVRPPRSEVSEVDQRGSRGRR
jgi:hypothetical protein